MTNERAKSELMQLYGSLSEEKKQALDVLMAQADGDILDTFGDKGKQKVFHISDTDITFAEEIDYEEAQRRFGYAMNHIGVIAVRGGI